MRYFLTSLALLITTGVHAQTTHIVSVGIDVNDYSYNEFTYDAQRTACGLLIGSPNQKVRTTVLLNEQATTSNLFQSLDDTKAKKADIVYVYIGAHGDMDKNQYYIRLHDKRLYGKALAKRLNALPCPSVLILDTCSAGGILRHSMPRTIVLAACTEEEYSDSSPFTDALVEGLGGEADYDWDGKVTARELGRWVRYKGAQNATAWQQTPEVRVPKKLEGMCLMKY